MRILVVGLGSMGKRRIRNLLKLQYCDVLGFDTREDRRREVCEKYCIRTFSTINSAIEQNPDVMIISTPPDLHLKYVKIAVKNNINFFTELNLLSSHVKEIIKLTSQKKLIAYPSSTMLFHPMIKELKRLLNKKVIGNIYTIQHHAGHFLPNWHPWESYKDFFVSKKITGGAREIVPMELIWLMSFFSDVKSVYGNLQKVSKLDVNIDDVYQIFMEFKNKILCTLLIDVISIPAFRETKLIGEKGTILCDFIKGRIIIDNGKKRKEMKLRLSKVAKGYKGSTPPEKLYEDEIQTFLHSIEKKSSYPYSFYDELKTLQILDKIEASSKIGKIILTK